MELWDVYIHEYFFNNAVPSSENSKILNVTSRRKNLFDRFIKINLFGLIGLIDMTNPLFIEYF